MFQKFLLYLAILYLEIQSYSRQRIWCDSVGSYCSTLRISAFTMGKIQLLGIEVEQTRKTANVHIHIEQVIRNIRKVLTSQCHTAHWLCNITSRMKDTKTEYVCCVLVNMSNSVTQCDKLKEMCFSVTLHLTCIYTMIIIHLTAYLFTLFEFREFSTVWTVPILWLGLTKQVQTAKVEPFMQTAWAITSHHFFEFHTRQYVFAKSPSCSFNLMELKMKVQVHLMKLNMKAH